MRIAYRAGFKYQVETDCAFPVPELAGFFSEIDWAELRNGTLTVRKGFCWDGPSGPVADQLPFMPASVAHDALYRMLRRKVLPPDCRKAADEIYMRLLIEAGVPEIEARRQYDGLRLFGGGAADPANDEPILTAP